MRELVNEILLRFVKPIAATALGAALYLILVGTGQASGSVELGLLCWLAGAGFILLAQESPF